MDEEIFGTDAEDMTDDNIPTEDGTDIPVDDDNPIKNSTETPDESESADMTDNGAETPDEDEKIPIIFPNDDEDDLVNDSADELEPEPESEQKPEPESQPEEPEEQPGEQPGEQPEEQAKKKLWDTIREVLSDFTKRFKREQDVKAEIVESQNQGLESVSEEKVSEEKQLTPAERIKVDACTAIMMAHLENHSINYTPETVKNIVQNALTTYAAALGSDRLLGGFRDASTTKRLISDVMSGITTDIQKEFGEQPIKVTVTASFGREEMRTIAKQMYSVLKIPNDDDHLGNSIRTTLDEIPNIKVPLTVSYMEALEERKKHETIIENNKTNISDLKKAIEDQKTSLNDIKEKFKAETGLDYDEITASKAPNTPDTNDTPDYSKILKPEYSELFEQCALLSSNLNGLNKSLEDQGRVDLPNINDDDEKIYDMEERLQNSGVPDITGFINELNPIAVSSSKELVEEDALVADVPADAPVDATPSDPTPEAAAEEAAIPDEQHKADAAEESASAAEESASAAEESASAAEESVSHADSEPGTTPADTDGQNQDGATELPAPIPESFTPSDPTPEPAADGQSQNDGATTEQHEGNDNAQGEKESTDSDDLESASATTPESNAMIEPESEAQDQNNGEPTAADAENHTDSRKTAFNGARTANMNGTDSKVAAEEEAARKAAEEAGEKRGNGYSGHTRKTGGFGRGGNK